MRMRHAAVVAGLALGLMSGTAKASVIIDITQVGNDVIAAGGGSIDLASLDFVNDGFLASPIAVRGTPSYFSGGTLNGPIGAYSGITGPQSIGPGTNQPKATSSSGDDFGFNLATGLVFIASGYSSGSPLAFSDTFGGQTIASLGLTDGSYKFSLVNGETQDSITVNIGNVSAVPLPASAPMFGAALLALGAVGYGLKRKKAAATA